MLDIAQNELHLQRSFGRGEICLGSKGLDRLYQQGCAKLLLPKTYGKTHEAVVVNTAGGLTGGDVFDIAVSAIEGANLSVSSQTAERIYRARSGRSQVVNKLHVGQGSTLHWLPQETIMFEGSALKRRLEIDIVADGEFLGVESVVLGRKASGETLFQCEMNDQWRVKRDGRLIYADGLRFGPQIGEIFGQKVTLANVGAFSNLIYVAPHAEERLDETRNLIKNMYVPCAVSAWNGMLLVRLMAKDGQKLIEMLTRLLQALRGSDMPRVWQI